MKPKRVRLTDKEQKLLDRMIENDIDFQEHLDSVPAITEGLGYDADQTY